MTRRPLFSDTMPMPAPEDTPRPARRGCRGNACSQGRRACPCPKVCGLEHTEHRREPRSVLWVMFEVFVFAVCALALWHAVTRAAQHLAG